jgi:hypothetical protein
MNELDFDNLMKDKLQNLSSTVPQGMWDKIAVKSAEGLHGEAFDEVIKNSVSNYSSVVSVGLWDKIITAHEIDSTIKEKLENYPSPVSEEMWDKVNEDEERKRRIIGWWWNNRGWLTAAAVLLLLIGGYAVFNNERKTTANNSSEETFLKKENNQQTSSSQNNTTNNNNNAANNIQLETQQNPALNNNHSYENNSSTSFNKNKKAVAALNDDKRTNSGFNQSNKAVVYSTQNNSIVDDFFTLAPKNYIAGDVELQNSLLTIGSYNLNIDALSLRGMSDCPSAKGDSRNDWYLEVYGSPDYNMKSVNANGLSDAYIQAKESAEKMSIGFTTGARIAHNIGDHIIIKTGLQYSQINEHFTKRTENYRQTTTIIDTLRDAQGNVVSVNARTLTQIGYKEQNSVNRYSTIAIPLSIGYEFGKPTDKWRVGINAGANVNVTSWYSGETIDTALNVVSINSKNSTGFYRQNVGVSLFGSVSALYKLSNTLDAFAEPYFRYDLSNVSSNIGYSQRFNTFGISFGIRMKLNNKKQHL